METLEISQIESKDKRKLKTNIGLSMQERGEIAGGLKKLLADSYCLMMMTQNYHWNVRGLQFRSVHLMTEEQYTALFSAIDEIAERIRSLGFKSPGTLKEFNDLTEINLPNANLGEEQMLADLLEGNEAIARSCRTFLQSLNEFEDEVTNDLVIQRMRYHEKTAWMLRSMLEA